MIHLSSKVRGHEKGLLYQFLTVLSVSVQLFKLFLSVLQAHLPLLQWKATEPVRDVRQCLHGCLGAPESLQLGSWQGAFLAHKVCSHFVLARRHDAPHHHGKNPHSKFPLEDPFPQGKSLQIPPALHEFVWHLVLGALQLRDARREIK